MDLFLITIATSLMVLGIIGSFLPVLPGPFTSWIGLLVVYFMPEIDISFVTLIVTLKIGLISGIVSGVVVTFIIHIFINKSLSLFVRNHQH